VSEPSKEALEMADRFCPRDETVAHREIAAALQKLMDERDRWRRAEEVQRTQADHWCKRAEAAEADAALAWRRVTELQESNTALVLERRALESRLAEAERLWEADRERARKMTEAAALEHKRTAGANGRLAELVRRVRQCEGDATAIGAVIHEYEAAR
jgi:chromosome segregation ATPase